jgi:hypothetical protein
LQLGFVLLIVYSFVRALGIDLGIKASQNISIQTLLAFLVVGGFSIAALLSDDPAMALKDLALVVVGFYFGTRARDEGTNGPDDGRRRQHTESPAGGSGGAPTAEPGPNSDSPEKPHTLAGRADEGAGESRRSNINRYERAADPTLGPRMDPANLETWEESKAEREDGPSNGRAFEKSNPFS